MSTVELLLVAVGLSMDAFAVSVCKGLGMQRINWRVAVTIALFFGAFQGLMPVIGWFLGHQLIWLIEPFDHWIAFILLAYIGGKMIHDAIHETDPRADEHAGAIGLAEIVMLAIATSIDALAVGISLGALGGGIGVPSLIIGITTFVLSLVGVILGHAFGARYERFAKIAGGVVLVGIGLKVLIEHLSGA